MVQKPLIYSLTENLIISKSLICSIQWQFLKSQHRDIAKINEIYNTIMNKEREWQLSLKETIEKYYSTDPHQT